MIMLWIDAFVWIAIVVVIVVMTVAVMVEVEVVMKIVMDAVICWNEWIFHNNIDNNDDDHATNQYYSNIINTSDGSFYFVFQFNNLFFYLPHISS